MEAVISAAILSVILMISSQVSINLSAITAEETDEVQMQTDVRRAVAEVAFLLEESKPVALWRENQLLIERPHIPSSIAPDGSPTVDTNGNGSTSDRGMAFSFATPLKTTDGRPLIKRYSPTTNPTRFGHTAYGVGDMGDGVEHTLIDTKKMNSYTIFFQADGEVYDESVEGVDIDNNLLTNDYFIYGGLFLSNDRTQEIRQITGRIALKRQLGTIADNDGRGKVFYFEAEPIVTDSNDNGIYDKDSIYSLDEFRDSDANPNGQWDVKMFIRFYFPITRDDARRGRVTRMRAVSARVNYFRNTIVN